MGGRTAAEGSFAEQVKAAREAALRLLSVRERSAMELRVRLRKKGFGAEVVVAALDRLTELDLQSDERFADGFSATAAARGYAARQIQGRLRARGVGPEVAAAAAASSPEEELERARAVANKRAARLTGLEPSAVHRRIAGLLARRGYDAEVCRQVAAEVAGDPEDHPGSDP